MARLARRTLETLAGKPRVVLSAGLLAVVLIALLHYVTGSAYEFHVLFGLPVAIIAWVCGLTAGVGTGSLAALLWLIDDLSLGNAQSEPLAAAFNTVTRFGYFSLLAYLLALLRSSLTREAALAREDPLTRLPNRRSVIESGQQALALADRSGGASLTIIFMDVDGFKGVNDRMGHDAGDRLLREIAVQIRAHVRSTDIPGRMGGDEFVIVMPNLNAKSALDYAERLRSRLVAAMVANGWPVTFSFGVAVRESPASLETLLARADEAMYAVKAEGKNAIRLVSV